MNEALQELAALSLSAKVLSAVLGILLIRTAFGLLEGTLPSRFGYGGVRHRIRKRVVLAGYIVGLTFIGILFKDSLGRLGFTLSILGAQV